MMGIFMIDKTAKVSDEGIMVNILACSMLSINMIKASSLLFHSRKRLYISPLVCSCFFI